MASWRGPRAIGVPASAWRKASVALKSGGLGRNISLKFQFDRMMADRFFIASVIGTSHGQALMNFSPWRGAARCQSGSEERTIAHLPQVSRVSPQLCAPEDRPMRRFR
jgi:hypothetical protein